MSKDLARLAIQNLTERPFLSGRPLVIYAAGGGAEALSDLQSQPGCSRVLVDGAVPYSRRAVRDLIGRELRSVTLPDGTRKGGATSAEAAHLLSWAAWVRAAELAYADGAKMEADGLPIGVAAACTLSGIGSGRAHGDEAWIAARTGTSGSTVMLVYMAWEVGQTQQDRAEQSRAVGEMILRVLAGQEAEALPPGTPYSVVVSEAAERAPMDLPRDNLYLAPDADAWVPASEAQLDPEKHYLLPGSFDPLTSGHMRMKIELDKLTGRQGIFQVSCAHFSKSPVPPGRLQRIATALGGVAGFVVAPDLRMALDKARVLGLDIAVGADVLGKISDEDLRGIAALGRRLLVVTRPGARIPAARRALLDDLDFELVSMNLGISATEVRAAALLAA